MLFRSRVEGGEEFSPLRTPVFRLQRDFHHLGDTIPIRHIGLPLQFSGILILRFFRILRVLRLQKIGICGIPKAVVVHPEQISQPMHFFRLSVPGHQPSINSLCRQAVCLPPNLSQRLPLFFFPTVPEGIHLKRLNQRLRRHVRRDIPQLPILRRILIVTEHAVEQKVHIGVHHLRYPIPSHGNHVIRGIVQCRTVRTEHALPIRVALFPQRKNRRVHKAHVGNDSVLRCPEHVLGD